MLNNKIWDKLLTNKSVAYRDIERYVYSEEYLKTFENFNFDFSGEEYNPFLVKYFFESEKYQNESDYEEVFFQRLIDGNISVQEYKKHENNFLNFMTELYKKSKAFAYYSLENPLCKSYPFSKCSDICFDVKSIEANNNKVFQVENENLFFQLCYLSAREIENVIFLFSDIQIVLINSGLHGVLLCKAKIDKNLKDALSESMTLTIQKPSY